MAAGEKDHVYALGMPMEGNAYTIHRYTQNGWKALAGKKAVSIAVGLHGRMYMIDGNGQIFYMPENLEWVKCTMDATERAKLDSEAARLTALAAEREALLNAESNAKLRALAEQAEAKLLFEKCKASPLCSQHMQDDTP